MDRNKAMKNPLQLVDRRGLTILLGSVFLITLISVIAIVLIVSSRNREAMRAEDERLRREQQTYTGSTSFGMEDFYLDISDPDAGIVYPARQPRRYWNREDVDFYWINPSEAGLDTLAEDNDSLVFRSLGIPVPGEVP